MASTTTTTATSTTATATTSPTTTATSSTRRRRGRRRRRRDARQRRQVDDRRQLWYEFWRLRGRPGLRRRQRGADLVKLMIGVNFGTNSGGFEEGLVYGADNGAQISSNSWGYTTPGYMPRALQLALEYYNAKDS